MLGNWDAGNPWDAFMQRGCKNEACATNKDHVHQHELDNGKNNSMKILQ